MTCPILIIEDELIIAESIAAILEEESYQVAGIATCYAEAAAFFRKSLPPLVVACDINLKGGENGIQVVTALKKQYDIEVVFITIRSETATVQEAIELNPVTYLVKPFSDRQLLVAMQIASHRVFKKYYGEQVSLDLSPREEEIARLVSQGYTSRQIAERLFISTETVRTHRKNMLQRNNLRSFPHLVFLLNKN